MKTRICVKLDPADLRALRRLAKHHKSSMSDVVRNALLMMEDVRTPRYHFTEVADTSFLDALPFKKKA